MLLVPIILLLIVILISILSRHWQTPLSRAIAFRGDHNEFLLMMLFSLAVLNIIAFLIYSLSRLSGR